MITKKEEVGDYTYNSGTLSQSKQTSKTMYEALVIPASDWLLHRAVQHHRHGTSLARMESVKTVRAQNLGCGVPTRKFAIYHRFIMLISQRATFKHILILKAFNSTGRIITIIITIRFGIAH